jgi:hypothetical protein
MRAPSSPDSLGVFVKHAITHWWPPNQQLWPLVDRASWVNSMNTHDDPNGCQIEEIFNKHWFFQPAMTLDHPKRSKLKGQKSSAKICPLTIFRWSWVIVGYRRLKKSMFIENLLYLTTIWVIVGLHGINSTSSIYQWSQLLIWGSSLVIACFTNTQKTACFCTCRFRVFSLYSKFLAKYERKKKRKYAGW